MHPTVSIDYIKHITSLTIQSDLRREQIRKYNLMFSPRWLWRMPSSGIWLRVGLVRTDVSEERVAWIFRVGKFTGEKQRQQLASRLNHQLRKILTMWELRALEWATWWINGGKVGCVEITGRPGKLVAGSLPEQEYEGVGMWSLRGQGYRASTHPVGTGQDFPIVYDLHSLVNLMSWSEGFMREQMRDLHNLLRRYVLPKRRFPQDTHSATSQKTAFFKYLNSFQILNILIFITQGKINSWTILISLYWLQLTRTKVYRINKTIAGLLYECRLRNTCS
jgi:hypothetical protein